MDDTKNKAKFTEFLTDLVKSGPKEEEETENPPIKLITYFLTEEEAEGECLEWAVQYLKSKNCPDGLTEEIARQTANEMSKGDLSSFHAPETPNIEDEELNDSQNNESTDEPEKPKSTRLEAIRLARATCKKVYEVCDRMKDSPPCVPPTPKLFCSVHAIKNTRRKMEDKHVIQTYFNTLCGLKDHPSQYYFSVFDGHGGVEAAHYAGAHLHNNLAKCPSLKEDPAKALAQAFIKTDEDFVAKSFREILKCGSTGVTVLLREDALYLAWLGDSQALLVRDGEPITLMDPHKPEREDEKQRIEDLGGCVVWFGAWRVNGSLSVSRAIGDAEHKPYVSGTPDVATFPLQGNEDYVILACDGLWDTVEPYQATQTVYDTIQEDKSKAEVAHRLVQLARDAGSTDNITVIVVFLRDNIAQPVPPKKLDLEVDSQEASTTESSTDNSTEEASGASESTNTNEVLSSQSSQDSTDSGINLSQQENANQSDTC